MFIILIFNHVKIYREGDFRIEYSDYKLSHNSFTRSLDIMKFTFKDNKLVQSIVRTLIAIVLVLFLLFSENNYNFDITMSALSSSNIIKLRRVTSKNVWNISTFNINNRIFTKNLFETIFNKYWKGIENKFTDHNHMFILFKIKYVNGEFATIGNLQRLSQNNKDWYINWIINNMEFKSEYYNETQIEQFIISYGFKDGKIVNKNIIKANLNYQNYKNNKLVISFNPLDYGKLVNKTILDNNEILYILQDKNNFIIKILSSENTNSIEYFKDGDVLIKYQDLKINNNSFIRVINSQKYYFENNNQVLFTKDLSKTKFISKLPKSKNLTNNFITLDIETYIKDNIMTPYCISTYDGKMTNSNYILDFKNSDEMLLSTLKSILIRKYNGYNIYIHNMAKFDIIFLLKYLVKLGNVSPIIHNGRIISINLNYGKNLEYRLQFKDSYLILLAAWAKLAQSFIVDIQKSIFPYKFVNENNLDYIGNVPEFKYFDNSKIKLADYNNYKSNLKGQWNLREETIKYCEIDCISLYQVIFKFSNMIFELFGKNIHHYPTLPSLAFAIFRSSFMESNLIPQLSGQIANDIRSGYTGGSCDVYIPRPPKGVKIKCYDVNSLYPFVMKNCLMPLGFPTYFNGNIRKVDPQAFGFFFCEIIAPTKIKHPIIQSHVKTNGGIRTIAPIGTWSDMIFSAEMDNAVKFGYKFNILWGYTFKKGYIFKDYVDNLYNLRLNYTKSNPLNYIAKILLNSLYGRFGMDDNFIEVNIVHKDFSSDFENKFLDLITNKIELGEYFLYEVKILEDKIVEDDKSTHNVSIAIAAAITAYARIHMSQFKNNPKIRLYYTDTDSIYTDSDLDQFFIDDKILGKLKLEYICKEAIFLAPKVYCLLTVDNEIIYKAKGLKHEVELTISDFEYLLHKDTLLKKSQTKWFRNLEEGHIKILEQLYTLQVTDNKRELIYNKTNYTKIGNY